MHGKSISRRHFLQTVGLITVGTVAAACGQGEQTVMAPQAVAMPVERPILPSPMPRPTVAVDDPTLVRFLALSALLTGYEVLNPILGQVYLEALQGQDLPASLDDLFVLAQNGGEELPATLEELEATGFFDNEAANTVASKILTYWYTGVYDTGPEEQAVATYVDALVWRAIEYTKPLTICGAPNFWAEAPVIRVA